MFPLDKKKCVFCGIFRNILILFCWKTKNFSFFFHVSMRHSQNWNEGLRPEIHHSAIFSISFERKLWFSEELMSQYVLLHFHLNEECIKHIFYCIALLFKQWLWRTNSFFICWNLFQEVKKTQQLSNLTIYLKYFPLCLD